MPGTDWQRLAYREKFRSLHGEAFQLWFEKLARALYPTGDFQPVRKTSGDGGMDGFIISSRLVYQVYAPARMEELRDALTAKKIRSDFAAAHICLSGKMKSWVFIHNHPEAKLGKLSITAINELRTQYQEVQISVLDIDTLWERLQDLSFGVLESFCRLSCLLRCVS